MPDTPAFIAAPQPAIFPTVSWGQTEATFLPQGETLPPDAPIVAALVFAIEDGQFVVADIAGRGWCIPGGHLESGETPEQAVRREAWEEAGLSLGPLTLLGHYRLTEAGASRLVPTYLADVMARDDVPPGTESRGVRLLTLEEMPAHYFTWDALIEAVFHCAAKARMKAEG